MPRVNPVLSDAQFEALAERGEERTAEAGEVLFEVGDKRYPFMAILEGEVEVQDANGEHVVRHHAPGFVGELNLLTGQTLFLRGVALTPMRFIAVEREDLRELLHEDAGLADLLLSTFMRRRENLQKRQGVGLQVIGPRDSARTREVLDWAHGLASPTPGSIPLSPRRRRRTIAGLDAESLPLVRFPDGAELRAPTAGELSRALGIGLELEPKEEVDLLVIGAGPAGLGAAVYGASEGLDTLVVERTGLGGPGGLIAPDRELPRVPRGHQRQRADEPGGDPGAQVQRPHGDALPGARAGAG